MKKIRDGAKGYSAWVGQEFTCLVTGSRYELEASDIVEALKNNDGKRIDHVVCPDCQAKVELGDSQLDGAYLAHDI